MCHWNPTADVLSALAVVAAPITGLDPDVYQLCRVAYFLHVSAHYYFVVDNRYRSMQVPWWVGNTSQAGFNTTAHNTLVPNPKIYASGHVR